MTALIANSQWYNGPKYMRQLTARTDGFHSQTSPKNKKKLKKLKKNWLEDYSIVRIINKILMGHQLWLSAQIDGGPIVISISCDESVARSKFSLRLRNQTICGYFGVQLINTLYQNINICAEFSLTFAVFEKLIK